MLQGFKYRMLKCCGHFECENLQPETWNLEPKHREIKTGYSYPVTSNRLHPCQELAMNVIHHVHQAVGLLKNLQLAVGASAFFHQFSNIINSMAATQFVHH